MTTEKTYTVSAGQWILLSLDLAYKKIFAVHREGIEHDLISLLTYVLQGNRCVGRQAWHNHITGVIVFDYENPFDSERINVVYET